MSSYRRYYLPSVSWSDVKGGVWRIQPYNVTDYFFIFRLLLLIAKTPGLQPGVSKHILVIIAIQLFHFLFTRVRIVQLQSYLCIITAYTIHDLEY